MSIFKRVGKTLQNLDAVLEEYRENLSDYANNMRLNGKNIEAANIEQPSWIAYYDQIASELYSLLAYVDTKEKEVRGKKLQYMKKNLEKIWTDTSMQKAIDADPDYLIIHQMYLEVEELYEKAKSIVECFKQRSYSLNNITTIRKHELENITIRINE